MERDSVLLAEQPLPQAATPDAPEALPPLIYDVVRHRGHWRVLHVGKHSLPHAGQDAAIDAAMKVAMERKAAGRTVVVRLCRTDGKVFDLTDAIAH